MILSVFLLAAATATGVSAHGYVPLLKIGNTYIPGWDISKDPYTTPQVWSILLLYPLGK